MKRAELWTAETRVRRWRGNTETLSAMKVLLERQIQVDTDLLGLEKETLQHQVRAHVEKGDKVSIDIAVEAIEAKDARAKVRGRMVRLVT